MSSNDFEEENFKYFDIAKPKLSHDCLGLKSTTNYIDKLKRENFNLKLKIYLLEQRLGHSNSLNLPNPRCNLEEEIVKIFKENQMLKKELAEKESVVESAINIIEYREKHSAQRAKNIFVVRKLSDRGQKKSQLRKKIAAIKKRKRVNLAIIDNNFFHDKITKLEDTIDKQKKIIDEQNYFLKSVNVRNFTFTIICLLILTRTL